MTAHNKKENGDDDATSEAEALDFDYTGEFATGSIAHDERGQARWKFKTESTPATSDPERTFDLLKALNNDALRVESAPSAGADKPTRHSGYNPYDVTGPDKSKSKP
jgi:hypothetical protein